MKIIANYTRKLTNENGDDEITFSVKGWSFKRDIKELIKQDYVLEIKVPKSKRSLDQNNLLWELIGKIAKVTNIDDMDIYCQLIEMAGAKYDYLMVLPEAVDRLKKAYRAVKVLKDIEHKGKLFKAVKAFYGSSTMNTQEMTELINITLDYAEQSGIDTSFYEGR